MSIEKMNSLIENLPKLDRKKIINSWIRLIKNEYKDNDLAKKIIKKDIKWLKGTL